jgi:hypothetical protein
VLEGAPALNTLRAAARLGSGAKKIGTRFFGSNLIVLNDVEDGSRASTQVGVNALYRRNARWWSGH